jgi:hypothetical protein
MRHEPVSSRIAGWTTGWPLVVVLLATHWVMAVTAVAHKSTTFDELAHLAGGYSYLVTGDYRLNPENGFLPQLWAALPLLARHCVFPPLAQSAWYASDLWEIGYQFFYRMGNDLGAMLAAGRAMIALLSVGLGLLVYLWSRRLFGPRGAVVSLLLYCFCPTVLANGSLVTSDMALALSLVAAVWSWWALLHRVSWGLLVANVLVLAVLFLSKMSAATILPIGLLLLGVRLLHREPPAVLLGRPRRVHGRGNQLLLFLGLMTFLAVAVVVLVWAAYGFRYSSFRGAQAGRDQFFGGWDWALESSGAVGAAVAFLRRHQWLPEHQLYGFAYMLKSAGVRSAFLNGHYSNVGWWYFFPYSFLVKTPVSLFAVLALALAAAVTKARASFRAGLYRVAPLLVLLGVYWAMAVGSRLNIGHRHILPVYPALFVLAGAAGSWFQARRRVLRAAVPVLLLAFMAESLSVRPDYLAFFNVLAGGPRHGYRHLVDSSLDWGQDLPGLRTWLDRHDLNGQNRTPVYLSYFGQGDPTWYGIRTGFLASYMDKWRVKGVEPLQGGVYCISATMLQGVYLEPCGPWAAPYERAYQGLLPEMRPFLDARRDPQARERLRQDRGRDYWEQAGSMFEELRLARLCSFLRQREPDDQVGHSILIYRLSDEDLDRALFGAPVELAPAIDVRDVPE